jgi:hypothetical protein
MNTKHQPRVSRAAITIDLHGIIDDLIASLRENGQVDLAADDLRAKSPAFLVITDGEVKKK